MMIIILRVYIICTRVGSFNRRGPCAASDLYADGLAPPPSTHPRQQPVTAE